MSEKDENNDENAIYRVDTVPPPEGEGDAYNAPTRVGPMADSVLKEMMHALESKTAELSQRAADRAKPVLSSVPPKVVEASQPPTAEKTSVAAAPPTTSPPQSPLKRPLPPRPMAAQRPSVPKLGAVTPPASAAPPPPEAGHASPPSAGSAPLVMPSFYDASDESDDAAPCPPDLDANGQPPPEPALLVPETEALRSVPPQPVNVATARPHAPIPFDPGPPVRAREALSLLPLAIAFGIFFVGLLLYLLVR